jgi:hypothetical protein
LVSGTEPESEPEDKSAAGMTILAEVPLAEVSLAEVPLAKATLAEVPLAEATRLAIDRSGTSGLALEIDKRIENE